MTEYAIVLLVESGEKPRRFLSEIVSNFDFTNELRTTVRHGVVLTRNGRAVATFDREKEDEK